MTESGQWLPPVALGNKVFTYHGGMGKENKHPHLNSAIQLPHPEQRRKEFHQEDTTHSISWLAQTRCQVSKLASPTPRQ